jgi:hypothetical protein
MMSLEVTFRAATTASFLCITESAQKSQSLPTLELLLKNMLRINHNIVAGEGKFKDYFLCFKLPDSLLPWDPTQDEWYI